MPRSLRARLLLAFLVVVAAALGTVGIAVLLVGPGYFAEAMGHLPGDPMGDAMAESTQVAFTDAMRQALVAATIIAVATATVVSIVVAGRIARPVGALARAARRIAGGDYRDRVRVSEPGELGELAASFNDMAGSLEATERRRLQLVGDVAHELRTPLTTLDGYLEGLEDGVVTPSAQTWHLLRAETSRLTRMVNELSELWRAEAHQLPLQIAAVDVAEAAREVGERFAPQAAARAITLALPSGPRDGDGRPGSCRADHRKLPVQCPASCAGRLPRDGIRRSQRELDPCCRRGRGAGSRHGSARGRVRALLPGGRGAKPRGRGIRESGWRSCARWPAQWTAWPGPRAMVRAGARRSSWSSRLPDGRPGGLACGDAPPGLLAPEATRPGPCCSRVPRRTTAAAPRGSSGSRPR